LEGFDAAENTGRKSGGDLSSHRKRTTPLEAFWGSEEECGANSCSFSQRLLNNGDQTTTKVTAKSGIELRS